MEAKEFQKWIADYYQSRGWADLDIFIRIGFLAGETGEVAECVKKLYRDHNGIVTEDIKKNITKEMGDVLWYLAGIARELDISFNEVAQTNIDKLFSRKERNVLHGNGDNR